MAQGGGRGVGPHDRFGIGQLEVVFVVHSHYDHAHNHPLNRALHMLAIPVGFSSVIDPGPESAAVIEAGGDPVEVSLRLPDASLATLAESLDAVLLPGSPADIETRRYDETRHEHTADADTPRERTDGLLLDHAFATARV